MKFNDTGTLSHWQLDGINVIEPLHDKAGGGLRGGAFLCLPNFEELSPPFSIKHGEYRITACGSQLPHRKILASATKSNWGHIDVISDWEEVEDHQGKTLTVNTTLRALSDAAWVRPGFHPYFSVTEDSFITIGTTRLAVASLPHDAMQCHPVVSLAETATLSTALYSVTVGCSVSPLIAKLSLAFAVWSDKKHQYVCIEPVIGLQADLNGLPTPLTLANGEELAMVFKIHANKADVTKLS